MYSNFKLKYLVNNWWLKNGPCKALHSINSIRFNFIKSMTNIKKKKILDIGCGGGILSEKLSLHGAHVMGIEKSNNLIKIAKIHSNSKKLNINYFNCDVYNIKIKKKFDIIVCMELIEHLQYKNLFLNICKNLLNGNGDLFITSIHRNIKTYLYMILGAEYTFNILPKKIHKYKDFDIPYELYKIIKKEKLQIKNIRGIKYDCITNIFKLSKKTDTNYIFHIKNKNI